MGPQRMSSPPVKYQRYFDFTTYATNFPDKPLPGPSVDQEFNRLKSTTDQTIDRLNLIQRDDGKLQDGAITTNSLADGSVTEPKLVTGAVSTRALAFASVDNTKLQPNAVTTSILLDQSVTTPKLADGSVTSAKLAGNITLPPAANIQINSLGVGMAAPVTPGGLAVAGLADLFSNLHVHNNAQIDGALGVSSVVHFLSTLVVDGVTTLNAKLNVTAGGIDVTGPSIFRSAVQLLAGASIAGLTVTGALALPDNSITSAMISDLAVGTADLMDGAVTNPKLGLNAVASGNVLPLAINTGHLQDLSVTTIKLANGAVDSSKIKDGSIDPADLSPATITLISSAGTPRGQWLTATNYAVRDTVTNVGGAYTATVAHLSGVFADDLAAGKWLQTAIFYDQSLNKADAVQFSKIGIGQPPSGYPLDITVNQNTFSAVVMRNSLAGAGAVAGYLAQNAAGHLLSIGMFSAAYAPSGGLTTADGASIYADGVGGLNIGTVGNNPLNLYINNALRAQLLNGSLDVKTGQIQVQNAGSAVNEILIQHDGSAGYIRTQAGGLYFGAAGANVTVMTTGLLAPLTTNAVALGQPANRWSNVFGIAGDFSGNVGIGASPNPAWAAAFKVAQIGAGAHYDAGSALGITSNTYYDGANQRYAAANAASVFALDSLAGGFTWYTAPVGAKDAVATLTQRMALSNTGVLTIGTINAQTVTTNNISQGNFTARRYVTVGGMVHGSNYDIIRVPQVANANTKVIIRAHITLANLQSNYTYHLREDIWDICDSGGVPNSRYMGNVYSLQYSINSSVINCTFSWDLIRSGGQDYMRLWPTCTGANSAGGTMTAYCEIILVGDAALQAF